MCQTLLFFFVIKMTRLCVHICFHTHTAVVIVVGAPEEETLRRTGNVLVSAHFLFPFLITLIFIPFFHTLL